MPTTIKQRRLSLSAKILLPLFFICLVTITLGWELFEHYYTREMENQVERRATSIVNSLEQFSEIVGISPELTRIIDSQGAERDIKILAIFQRNPLALVTMGGEDLPTDELLSKITKSFPERNFPQALQAGKNFKGSSANAMEGGDTDYTVLLPISLKNPGSSKLVPGMIYLQLEVTDLIKEINHHVRQMMTWLAIITLFIAGMMYWVLQRYVLQPISDIHHTINHRAEGDVSAYVTVLRDDEVGDVGHALNSMLDKQEGYKIDLKNAHTLAEKANLTKSDFLANMSHELRTPLNSILGMTRLLLESDLKKEQRELADVSFQSSLNLLEIVNDILDLSKIEAGGMQLEHIGFDGVYAFDSVIHTLTHIAKEKRLPVTASYKQEEFPYILGDPLRFSRILINLMSNAIKYTDHGHVDFKSTCKKLDDTHVEIRCEITDTGIGIPKDKLDSIFEKFVQADTSNTRQYGGTGLGLAITKQLVELMGGTIGVESEVGKGSVFWVAIPFEITAQLSQGKHTRKNRRVDGSILPEQVRILVAEDHPLNQLFIKKVMEKFGISRFEIVDDGMEALKRYKEDAWDIILMDCHMPKMNGYDAAKEIRNLEKVTNAHVKIAAMTANAMLGEKEKCLRYGMDDYISKPINMDELRDILGQWVRFGDSPKRDDQKKPETDSSLPVDLSGLNSFTEGDKETEKEFIGIFMEQSERILKALEDAHEIEAEKAWTEAAHKLKGGAGGVGANTLQRLCDQAQHFKGTVTERFELFKKIKDEYARVKNYLEEVILPS